MPWICGEPECKKQPYYADPGSKKPKFCFLHKHVGHIDVRNKRCEVPNCEIRPHYGYDGEAPRFCAQHRAEGMHNLRSRRCQSDGCVRYASCGHAGNPPVYCGAHKTIGMVNLIGRRCAVDNCETYASYGNSGEKARYCAKHKGNDMVNLTVKHCEFQGCVTQPSFNYAGQRKAKFCARHRLENMVDVLDRHCAQHGCDRQPIYGQAGEKEGRPMWCPDHRPTGSFDVKTSRCQEPGCLKHPSYGYDRDRIRRRCRLHKLDDMVDVKSPRCEMVRCRKQPCCGFPGLKPRFCSEHKQDGMLNLKTRAFRCKHRGPANRELGSDVADDPLMPMPAGKSAPCNRACRFAYPGEEAIYCAKHKLPGMMDVVNPTCKMQDCPEEPTHGYDGESATFCANHMAVGMKPIPVLRPAGQHWSAELRRQATQTARERSKLEADLETGSARCTPLPPKASTMEEKRLRQQEATMAAIEAAAASVRGPEAHAANIALNSREMLSASTAPIVPPFINERDMGPSSITSAELALAFSGLQDDDMGGAAAANPGPALPGIGADNNLGRISQAGESEYGPTKKRRRPGEASTTQSVSTAYPNAYASAAASAAAAAAAAAASAAASASSFGDPSIFQAAYSNEFMASMAAAAASGGMPPPLPTLTNATATPGGMIGMGGMPAIGAVLPMVPAGSSAPAPTPMDTTPLMTPAMYPPLAAVSDAMLTNPMPSSDPGAISAAAGGIPQSTIAGAPVVPTVGSKCAVADCVAPATFGHPGPGHVPTHCLTHCEEGMHRLAADETRAPLGAKMAGKGKRKADDALVPASRMQASTALVATTMAMEEASAYVASVSPVAEMSASLTATTLAMTTDTVPSTALTPATAVTTSIADIPSTSVGIAATAAPVMAPAPALAVSPPISAPVPGPVVEELGRGKRIKKRTAVAHEGMMLLAGAVASHSHNAGEEDGEETDTEDNGNVSAGAMVASTNLTPTVPV